MNGQKIYKNKEYIIAIFKEMVEDTKGIIRNKDRQCNGQNKWDKRTKNKDDLQNTTQKTKD
jgi:hypothetical protein